MTHLSPIENLFAVEVPGDAYTFSIKSNTLTCLTGEEGFTWKVFLLPGSYEILFTTKDCSEEQASGVVEQQTGGGRFNDYLVTGSLKKTGTYLMYRAKNSLNTLLVSCGLDLAKNYLLIKKKPG